MADLNQVDSGYAGHLIFANDINDTGVVTGQARNVAGDLEAFVATPVR